MSEILPSMEELLARAEAKGFADGQNEIANKTLLEIRRESIQIGREIERENVKAIAILLKESYEEFTKVNDTKIRARFLGKIDAIDEFIKKLGEQTDECNN